MKIKLLKELKKISHEPVLLAEVRDYLPESCEVVVDGTLGLGGHAKMILQERRVRRYVGFEKDLENLRKAKRNLALNESRLDLKNEGYESMEKFLKEGEADVVLLDLGLCMTQLQEGQRGFSFMREGPLDMRFDKRKEVRAAEVVNNWDEGDLVQLFREYGGEKRAGRVARAIIRKRPFYTTTELAKVVEEVLGEGGRVHAATKVFQALRIEVNQELEFLKMGLRSALKILRSGGRLIVISYHSLEDGIVKNFLREKSRGWTEDKVMGRREVPKEVEVLTKKVVVPSEEEVGRNVSSRSAKMRVGEKI